MTALARAASGGLARRVPLPNAAGMPPGLHFWPPSVMSVTSLSSLLASAPVVGVSGSRAPSPASASVCRWALRQLAPGASVVTGCAAGIDGVARLAMPVGVGHPGLGVRGRARRAGGSVRRRRPRRGVGRPVGALARVPVRAVPAGPGPVAPVVGVLRRSRVGHVGVGRAGGRARRARARVRAVGRGRAARQRAGRLAPRAGPGLCRSARGVAPVPAGRRAVGALRLTRRCRFCERPLAPPQTTSRVDKSGPQTTGFA